MDELIQVHGRLLALERECELAQASNDVLLLQRRDARLMIERIDRSTGLGGRTTVQMKRRADLPLALGRIGVGDIVAIRPVAPLSSSAAAVLPKGVVSKLSDLSVTVVLDDENNSNSSNSSNVTDDGGDDEVFVVTENASVFLVRLANDVTYTRLREALNMLPSMRDSRVARVCFGETEPHALGESGAEFSVIDAALNASQVDAVRFALASSDVAVIHGPPGTGKTTTVVELVRQLVRRGRRVLVCAPSNTAVDNLLAKLAPCMMRGELKLSRVGHAARVSEALLPFSLDNAVLQSDDMGLARDIREDIARINTQLAGARGAEKRTLYGELRALRTDVRKRERLAKARTLAACDVVLATCIGAGSHSFRASAMRGADPDSSRKPFDVVIIDEAAQALELSCWIPIALGSRVVLAGDHLQLPPTIFSDEAARGGLATTLVDRVVKRWGDKCTRLLSTQYRMHENIMSFSNTMLYDGKLVAHESVAAHKLVGLDGVVAIVDDDDDDDESYEAHALEELLLIDTTGCEMHEAVESGGDGGVGGEDEESKSNAGEVAVVAHHVELLVASGVPPASIGVLSPYNGQVRLLKERLLKQFPALEIGSVDGFQGREKEAIVISFVRSNTQGTVGFLKDDRRTNVAITRARRHLALIGDSRTLSSHAFLGRLVAFVQMCGHVHSAAELAVDDSWQATNVVAASTPKNKKKKEKARDKPKKLSETEEEARNEKIRQGVSDRIVAFLSTADDELRLPATLTSFERMVAHEIAERRGLVHKSEGQGSDRQIVIRRPVKEVEEAPPTYNFEADDNDNDENKEEEEEDDDDGVQDDDEDDVIDDEAVEDAEEEEIANDDNNVTDDNADDNSDVNVTSSSSTSASASSPIAATSAAPAPKPTSSGGKSIVPPKSRYPTKPNIAGMPTRYMTTDQALDAAIAAKNRCAMLKCRADVTMFSMQCEFCKQTYCTSHAIAFVHGCRDAAQKKRQAEVDAQLKHLKNNTKPMTNLKPMEHARAEAKVTRLMAEKRAARAPQATRADEKARREAGRGSKPSGPPTRGRGRGRGRG